MIEYKVAITSFPATAAPGTIADYDFEVRSTGDKPSDKLKLAATIQGQTGTMLPLTASNNPHGASGSTLPNTVLQSIDCLSSVLGSFPPGSVGVGTAQSRQNVQVVAAGVVPTVPTLSEGGLIGLAAFLALLGLVVLRRRRAAD